MAANNNQYALKYLNHNLDNELILMDEYKINPNELFAIKIILLAQDGEYEYLQKFAKIFPLRTILESLQSNGIILKSWKLPKEGSKLDVEDIPFNQNFLKRFYRSAFEMGEELFYTYPQSCIVNGQYFNLRRISKKCDSLEQAFSRYGKYINNNPEKHKEVLELIRWGIENNYSFTTLDSFIIDKDWNNIKNMKETGIININNDSIKLI